MEETKSEQLFRIIAATAIEQQRMEVILDVPEEQVEGLGNRLESLSDLIASYELFGGKRKKIKVMLTDAGYTLAASNKD